MDGDSVRARAPDLPLGVSVWAARRARALARAAEAPHAAEILGCYASVTEVQERVAARLPASEVMAAVASPVEPFLTLARMPYDLVLPLFDAFVEGMAGVGTPVMVAEAADWASRGDDEKRSALEAAMSVEGDDATEGAAQTFHARAFAEVVATTLAGRVLPVTESAEVGGATGCRLCGARPLVATLRDLPGALGSRGLVCGRCGSERRARRLTCAYCGDASPDKQRVHTAESVKHVRVDECSSCHRYIKTVDLRQRGDASPIVEDLATPELDLWAQEQGLTKGRVNLFGL
jgi:formate dehydrogenase accessory protein FdhE